MRKRRSVVCKCAWCVIHGLGLLLLGTKRKCCERRVERSVHNWKSRGASVLCIELRHVVTKRGYKIRISVQKIFVFNRTKVASLWGMRVLSTCAWATKRIRVAEGPGEGSCVVDVGGHQKISRADPKLSRVSVYGVRITNQGPVIHTISEVKSTSLSR